MTDISANPVGLLQELCQKNCLAFPVYSGLTASGPDHCRSFGISCNFHDLTTSGSGSDKKGAKKDAAAKMVQLLNENGLLSKLNEKNNKVCQLNNTTVTDGLEPQSKLMTEVKFGTASNPVSALMEFCAKKKIHPPEFFEAKTKPGSDKCFMIGCKLKDKTTFGQGNNKKSAKLDCAAKMCHELNLCSPMANHEEEASFDDEKSYVTKLQEYVLKNNLKPPIYQESILMNNLIKVVCNLEHVSGKGIDSSMEEAKSLAACEVLKQLYKESLQMKNGESEPIFKIHRDEVQLSDFDLEDNTSENNLEGPVVTELENLLLDDSVVEVEPTSNH